MATRKAKRLAQTDSTVIPPIPLQFWDIEKIVGSWTKRRRVMLLSNGRKRSARIDKLDKEI